MRQIKGNCKRKKVGLNITQKNKWLHKRSEYVYNTVVIDCLYCKIVRYL